MSEGRTSAGRPDAEVEPTSTSGTTPGDGDVDATGTSDATDATRTDAAHTEQTERTEHADAERPSETAQPGDTVAAATLPGEPDAGESGRHGAAEDENAWADAEDKAYRQELRKGLAFGAAGGLVLGAIVALLLGAFVYPGYLGGPGNPDDAANQVVSALAAKDAPGLEQLSCKGPDGNSVSQLSPQVLQLIGSVRPSGPTTTVIDTEARTPVDLTLTYQGQTQTLPSEIVLGQSQGSWCLKGLAQRQ